MFSFFSTTGLLENCDVFCQQNLLNFRPSCFSIGFLAKTLCVLQNKLARIPLIQASWQIFGVFCKRNSGKKSWKTMEIYHGRCFSKLFSLLASCLISAFWQLQNRDNLAGSEYFSMYSNKIEKHLLVLNCFCCTGELNDGVFKLNKDVFGDVMLRERKRARTLVGNFNNNKNT